MTTYAMDLSLTTVPGQELVGKTHLGQAHLAGTGPEGKSCRMCSHWHNYKGNKRHYDYLSNAEGMMQLQPSRCRYPIMNKALRRVPHYAPACRFFKENPEPPVIERENLREKKKVAK